jgi:protein-tyrosine phosphatase
VAEFQELLDQHEIGLRVLPGADVRIEPDMLSLIQAGQVLTLGDHGRHVLLELPHEIYFPLEPVLEQLHAAGMVGILSHPERNQGLLRDPRHLAPLVEMGCLMQVTCGSLTGTFGPASQQMSEWMLDQGLVHILATDAHGARSRRPLMDRSYQIASRLAGPEVATRLCCTNPTAIAAGRDIGDSRKPNKRAAARSGR